MSVRSKPPIGLVPIAESDLTTPKNQTTSTLSRRPEPAIKPRQRAQQPVTEESELERELNRKPGNWFVKFVTQHETFSVTNYLAWVGWLQPLFLKTQKTTQQAVQYIKLASTLRELDKLTEAIDLLERALPAVRIKDVYWGAVAYEQLGLTYKAQKDVDRRSITSKWPVADTQNSILWPVPGR